MGPSSAPNNRVIGRYTVADEIGRGGFATVYRAADADHGREVAIKILHGVVGDAERRRFDRERQAMGRLGNHPGIIPVYDSGYTEGGEAYLVMELAAGGSLQTRLDTAGALPWTEAVAHIATVARAVDVAHRLEVLHRDIKPDNILIDAFGNPKLSDFGIAAVANNATATTTTKATLAHAAPELLSGQPPTEAVDVYALGSTLHTLIRAEAPFVRPGEELATALIARTLTEPPPDLRPFGVPHPVAAVIERAMAKEPGQRQATAAILADELEAAAAGAPAASPSGPVPAPGAPAASPSGPVPAPGPSAGTGPADAERLTAVVGPNATEAMSAPPPRHHTPVGASVTPGGPVAPAPPRQPEGSSRRSLGLLAVVGVMVLAVVGGILVVLSQGGDDDPTAAGGDTDGGSSVPAASESTAPDSSETSTTLSTSSSTSSSSTSTTSTTATTEPLVEVDLTRSLGASASAEADDGSDGCGNTTTFRAENVLDGDRTTAWRVAGDGRGQWLEFDLGSSQRVTSVGLVPGYAKVDRCDGVNRFFQNHRVTVVRWHIGGEVIEQRLDPDRADLQSFDLTEPIATSIVRVEIVSTTDNGGRPFTAISDIEIRGG